MKARVQTKKRRRWHLPKVTVVVPAHNEEKTIERALMSLYKSDYPASKLEVIVINDGSTDNTKSIVADFKKTHRDGCKIRLLNRPNKGKAAALNYGLKRSNFGSLVMCLDSDSYLDKQALRNAVQHFRDRKLVALSSNVNIPEDGTVLALVQRYEYIVCYQMKKGQALLGVEYIVGGIGSMFRKSMLEKVEFYDSNTMTEDIDLTLKIIVNKNKGQKIGYAADSVVYTEPARPLSALLRQRFRWKYGRNQTYAKNGQLFFDRTGRFAKRLTWFMLPFSLLQDLLFFIEPAVLIYFLYNSLRYAQTGIFTSAICVLSFYILFNIWSTEHLKVKERLRLSFYAPPMYFLMYVLSIAEYFALIKALVLTPKLKASITRKHHTWRSPIRKGLPISSSTAKV